MLVLEFMEYGSLYDLLRNDTLTLSGEIILQVVRDIAQGIQFLHASRPPILHGDLKAKNILVDSRFRAKVADFGFSHMNNLRATNVLRGTPFYMAPEYLRRRSEYTTHCDIYSVAMIIYEIYARQSPFEGEDPRKILPKVCHPRHNKRPPIPVSCPPKMAELMKKCWNANAFFRPQAKDLDYFFAEMKAQDAEPVKTQEEIARELARRKPASLFDVFPKKIAEALNAGQKVEAETHDMVSIFFSNIVGFTTMTQSLNPLTVSNMLDRLNSAFSDLSRKHKIFKVETIGDAWMGVTNLDHDEVETHARHIAEFAQDAILAARNIAIDEDDLSRGYLNIRVGLHSGPVVANVVGYLNSRYALFGDTVNTASRMESCSLPGRIQCSFSTAELLKQQAPEIPLEFRGNVKIKGKGVMRTFWIGPESLAMMPPPSTFSVRAVSERDDNAHTESQSEHSNSGEVSEMNDSLHGVTVKMGVLPAAASIDAISVRTAATVLVDNSLCSDGSYPGGNSVSPSYQSHLSNSHQPVKISMDGYLEPIPSDDFPMPEV